MMFSSYGDGVWVHEDLTSYNAPFSKFLTKLTHFRFFFNVSTKLTRLKKKRSANEETPTSFLCCGDTLRTLIKSHK